MNPLLNTVHFIVYVSCHMHIIMNLHEKNKTIQSNIIQIQKHKLISTFNFVGGIKKEAKEVTNTNEQTTHVYNKNKTILNVRL